MRADLHTDVAAFDELPREVRVAVANLSFKVLCSDVLLALHRGGVDYVLASLKHSDRLNAVAYRAQFENGV